MAGMTTALTEFSTLGDSRTSTITGHTAIQPKLVIEKRRVPVGNQSMAEYSFKVVEATTDVNDVVLTNKVSFEATVRFPLLGNTTDRDAALAVFRDVIAGDEFGASVGSLNFL